MTGRRYNLANGDVSKVFKAPQDIVNAVDVPTDKKIELLRDWEMDLREVLVASEEGMTRNASDAGEVLRQVRLSLDKLGASDTETHAPNKAGS